MAHRLSSVMLLFCVFALQPGAPARAQDEIKVPLSRPAILKMGYERFSKWWGAQHGEEINDGEQSLDRCAMFYAPLRRSANQKQMERLPRPDRRRMERARTLLLKWTSALIETQRVYEGGGTMYDHWNNRKDAEVEDLLAECLRQYRAKPRRTPHASAQLSQVEGILRPIRPRDDGIPEPDGSRFYREYRQSHREERALFRQLKPAILALPPLPREKLADYVATTIHAAF